MFCRGDGMGEYVFGLGEMTQTKVLKEKVQPVFWCKGGRNIEKEALAMDSEESKESFSNRKHESR